MTSWSNNHKKNKATGKSELDTDGAKWPQVELHLGCSSTSTKKRIKTQLDPELNWEPSASLGRRARRETQRERESARERRSKSWTNQQPVGGV